MNLRLNKFLSSAQQKSKSNYNLRLRNKKMNQRKRIKKKKRLMRTKMKMKMGKILRSPKNSSIRSSTIASLPLCWLICKIQISSFVL